MPTDLRIITHPTDLRQVSRTLRRVGNPPAIRKRMMKGLRAGVKPATAAAKAAALALPSAGRKHSGLRVLMSRSISTQIRTGKDAGIRVRVSRAKMGDRASLAKVTNQGSWRHPVFGNRDVWVRQSTTPKWFDRSVSASAPAVRAEIKKVMDGIEHDLRSI